MEILIYILTNLIWAWLWYVAFRWTILGFKLIWHFFGSFGIKERLHRFGKVAVITGCTRGIGREFATLLAENGMDLVLIARKADQLERLAVELRERYNVNVETVISDFTQTNIYPRLKAKLADRDVGILVNNVAVMYDYPEQFDKLSEKFLWDLINVNMASLTLMTHMVIRECMLPQKSGLVVCMSSGVCGKPQPSLSAYGGTKAYVDYLARSLCSEYSSHGIFVQSLIPYYIATEMTKYSDIINRESWFSPSANTYARQALWTFGRTKRSPGYWPHIIQHNTLEDIPEWMYTAFSKRLMEYFNANAKNKAK